MLVKMLWLKTFWLRFLTIFQRQEVLALSWIVLSLLAAWLSMQQDWLVGSFRQLLGAAAFVVILFFGRPAEFRQRVFLGGGLLLVVILQFPLFLVTPLLVLPFFLQWGGVFALFSGVLLLFQLASYVAFCRVLRNLDLVGRSAALSASSDSSRWKQEKADQ